MNKNMDTLFEQSPTKTINTEHLFGIKCSFDVFGDSIGYISLIADDNLFLKLFVYFIYILVFFFWELFF